MPFLVNLQDSLQVSVWVESDLFVEEVECQLESDSLHVRLLEGAGDVHVHVEEPVHGPSLLGLLDLQLGEEVDEPLE